MSARTGLKRAVIWLCAGMRPVTPGQGVPARTPAITPLRPLLLLLGLATIAVGTPGCDKTNLYSTRDEVRVGQAASKEMERRYRVDSTSADARRVRRIGERLLLHSDRREGVPYTFKIIDAKDINAVSLPGGPVYVYRGLLDLLGDDDDALAGVIGHEIGHINARHAAKQMSNQELTNLGIQLILKGQTAQSIAAVLSDLLSLHYSRDDEYEADLRGLSYAYKAGFDPRGLVRFFEKLQSQERKGGTPEVLRTHPLTRNRIQRAERIIESQRYPYGQ